MLSSSSNKQQRWLVTILLVLLIIIFPLAASRRRGRFHSRRSSRRYYDDSSSSSSSSSSEDKKWFTIPTISHDNIHLDVVLVNYCNSNTDDIDLESFYNYWETAVVEQSSFTSFSLQTSVGENCNLPSPYSSSSLRYYNNLFRYQINILLLQNDHHHERRRVLSRLVRKHSRYYRPDAVATFVITTKDDGPIKKELTSGCSNGKGSINFYSRSSSVSQLITTDYPTPGSMASQLMCTNLLHASFNGSCNCGNLKTRQLKDGTWACKKKEKNCLWLPKCIQYEINEYSTTCRNQQLVNILGQGDIPWELDNTNVTLTSLSYAASKTFNTISDKGFINDFDLYDPGLYSMSVRSDELFCTSEIAVNIKKHARRSSSCNYRRKRRNGRYKNRRDLKRATRALREFLSQINDNNSSTCNSCNDIVTTKVRYVGSRHQHHTETNLHHLSSLTSLQDQDLQYIKSFKASVVDMTREVPMIRSGKGRLKAVSKKAKKCWDIRVRTGHLKSNYYCTNNDDSLSKLKCVYDKHNSCRLSQCLTITGRDLFRAKIDTVLLQHLNNNNFKDFQPKRDVVVPFKVKDSVDLSQYKSISIISDNITDSVQCRYRRIRSIDEWNLWSFTDANELEFSDEDFARVELECWSIIGRIRRQVFSVYRQAAPPSVCPDFEITSPTEFCAADGYTFVPVVLDFDNIMMPPSLSSVKCYSQYSNASTSQALLLDTKAAASRAFIFELDKSEFTSIDGITSVQVTCDFGFESCSKTLLLQDCTPPVFKKCEDDECDYDCKADLRYNEVCGDKSNYVSRFSNNNASCCAACNLRCQKLENFHTSVCKKDSENFIISGSN